MHANTWISKISAKKPNSKIGFARVNNIFVTEGGGLGASGEPDFDDVWLFDSNLCLVIELVCAVDQMHTINMLCVGVSARLSQSIFNEFPHKSHNTHLDSASLKLK